MNSEMIRQKLLSWYQANKRDLPWRREAGPYAIWLSEIMLQQTTVATVIPYYLRFLEKYPNLESLAQAPIDELLKEWSGLGYYNRIRNFQATAQHIVKYHNGVIPHTKEELIKLKGFGPYTAATVSSIAFNQPNACVDGNVMRVIARIKTYDQDIKSSAAKKFFSDTASLWLDTDNPGDFNQAMMELGATVCTPVNPKCPECPLSEFCQALRANKQLEFPKKEKATYTQIKWDCYFITNKRDEVLLRQRVNQSVMKDMWELPYFEHGKQTATINFLSGPKKNQATYLGQLSHAIMNARIKIDLWRMPNTEVTNQFQNSVWVPLSELKKRALTTVTQKALKKIQTNKISQN